MLIKIPHVDDGTFVMTNITSTTLIQCQHVTTLLPPHTPRLQFSSQVKFLSRVQSTFECNGISDEKIPACLTYRSIIQE